MSLAKLLTVALAVALTPEVSAVRTQQKAKHGGAAEKQASRSPYLRHDAQGWSAKGDPYGYENALGQSLKFLEVQRSGRLSESPGGYRVDWRHDQLLHDGEDVGLELVGGWYEAGSAHLTLLDMHCHCHRSPSPAHKHTTGVCCQLNGRACSSCWTVTQTEAK